MSLNLNIVIAYPAKGDAESIEAWKEAVLWAQRNVHCGAVSTPAAPSTLPSVASALRASNGAEKGHWERAWIEKSGRKSVRFTPRIQALYPDKESYCQALCEGSVKDDSAEDESPAPTAPPIVEVGEDWN